MARPRHSNKHIEAAVEYAIEQGWRYVETSGQAHAWGRLMCPFANRDGCIISVWSTPRVPENHARQIRSRVDACQHQMKTDGKSVGEEE